MRQHYLLHVQQRSTSSEYTAAEHAVATNLLSRPSSCYQIYPLGELGIVDIRCRVFSYTRGYKVRIDRHFVRLRYEPRPDGRARAEFQIHTIGTSHDAVDEAMDQIYTVVTRVGRGAGQAYLDASMCEMRSRHLDE